MGTITFCEILYNVLRQSRLRLVHELNLCLRNSFHYESTYKGNIRKELPVVRFPLMTKWYYYRLLYTCQNNAIIMPKRKLVESSSSEHPEKSAKNSHPKTKSLKHIKKKKRKLHHRHHHHHHKRKRSKKDSSSSKPKKRVAVVPEPELVLLDSSSENDSDICIVYESRKRTKLSTTPKTVPKSLTKNSAAKLEVQVQLEVQISEPIDVKIDSAGYEQGVTVESNLPKVYFTSARPTPTSSNTACTSKGSEDEDSVCVSPPASDGSASTLKTDQVNTGAPTEAVIDKKTCDLKQDRNWEYTSAKQMMDNYTKDVTSSEKSYLMFDVLSYNVLCQEIMEETMHLYTYHDSVALDWEYRSKLLMKEFLGFNADVMCLQEVQKSHLQSYYSQLEKLGYTGLFKQRTGCKKDGVAIYFKNSVFKLVDHTTVEYYQPGVSVLNRDNVGLVVKLAPVAKPSERIIIATTHLLYNPNRHDVKLAQLQLLLAEIERFAFKEVDKSTQSTKYWPVIMTGDMNFEPHTGGFQLLNSGWFQFEGLFSKTLSSELYGYNTYSNILGKELIPPYLGVTDSCQHWNLIAQRGLQFASDGGTEKSKHEKEVPLLQIYNSDFKSSSQSEKSKPETSEEQKQLNDFEKGFQTGQLSHSLRLCSVYPHDPMSSMSSVRNQVSTYQNGWVVVDYIFYSYDWNSSISKREEGNLKLVARYKLFNEREATLRGPIPNLSSPSDHYPLAAKFALLF